MAGMARSDLQLVVLGAVEQPPIFTIDFPTEAGGDEERQFALPFLPGMDEIVVREAELGFRVGDFKVDATYSQTPVPGGGTRVTLTRPGRLREMVVEHLPKPPGTRLVVRPVQDGAAGPPMFADDPFPPPGAMFGKVLDGMTVTELSAGQRRLVFPDLVGSAWQLAIAAGSEVTDLAPQPIAVTVHTVGLAAAPRNLSLTLLGDPPIPLWGNSDVLTRASGEQTVSFLPIAQRRLSDALAAANAAQATQPPPLTLGLSLRFHSDSAGKLEVTRCRLSGEYRVKPLGAAPVTLGLGGRPAPLVLKAPPGLRPNRGQATLTARLAGRALNGASAGASTGPAGSGLQATTDRWLAARVPVAARRPGDSIVPIASVSILAGVPEAAEIVLELRADINGRPGAILAPPVVRQLPVFAGWLDFLLKAPLGIPTGEAFWAGIRLTKGRALWHARDGAASSEGLGRPAVSVDRGSSWADSSATLGAAGELLVQAFHALDPPFPRPQVRLHDGHSVQAGDWLAAAQPEGPDQYRAVAIALPAALLDRIAAAPATAGSLAETRLALHSDSVLDLVLGDVMLGYEALAS
jgi:hypothetical protein